LGEKVEDLLFEATTLFVGTFRDHLQVGRRRVRAIKLVGPPSIDIFDGMSAL
jgi:hypothetical protein